MVHLIKKIFYSFVYLWGFDNICCLFESFWAGACTCGWMLDVSNELMSLYVYCVEVKLNPTLCITK